MNMKVAVGLSLIVVLASGTSACSHGATRGGLLGGAGGAVVGSATGLGALVGGTAGAIISDTKK